MPQGCRDHAEHQLDSEGRIRSAEARWNDHYLAAIDALAAGDTSSSQDLFCRALSAATAFGPRDWRFAETLDELGLVGYLSGDFELAEAMQGAAVAELLLALGPDAAAVGSASPGRPGRLSSVALYAARLNGIYKKLGKSELAAGIDRTPYRLLERGYLPLDATLARRLDWLISQYLLRENFAAARWLRELRTEILSGG